MIIDVTGVELTPGNFGKDCLGNGKHIDANGDIIECCCDECDYLMCCSEGYCNLDECKTCMDTDCMRSAYNNK